MIHLPVTDAGTPGTLADLATLTRRNATTSPDWIVKVAVWILKRRKQLDVQ